MRPDNDRWVEVTPSRFSHERAGLRRVQALFPDREPYRAWSNLEIITDRGRSLEVDLLVLAPGGLYLIELKAWGGRISGDRYTWRIGGDHVRTVDNPWRLANEKAKILKGLLVQAVGRHARELGRRIEAKDVVPYVRAAVFLHGPDVRCELAADDRTSLYGLDGEEERTGLPGIISGLITRQPANPDRTVTALKAEVVAGLMGHIGMTRRGKRVVGPYELDDQVDAEGPGWQDFLATHQRFRDECVRVRLYHTGASTTREERATLTRAAEREYRLLRHLSHPGLVAPGEFHETDMGPALVYAYDPRSERLDRLMAARPDGLALGTELQIIRGLAEIVRYAHGRHITHRGLSPRSVLVRLRGDDPPRVRVADWQTAARSAATSASTPGGAESLLTGTRHLDALVEDETLVYLAPELAARRGADDARADVFSLGAIAYLVLCGQPPAPDPSRLRIRLYEQGGLDLAGLVDGVPESLRSLVLDATRGEAAARLPDVQTFLDRLGEVEEELTPPEPPEETDPLDATPGSVIGERWRLLRRLGSGATATGLFIEDLDDDRARKVLKVARDEGRAQRLRDEADVLRGLDDPRVVRLLEGPLDVGGRTALVLEYAGDQTLATVLRRDGRPSLDWLERYGNDLLAAVAYLHGSGVDHRDIKPDNLGVRERPADRSKHLVLFDFSLARTPASEIRAGTPPYLDPFLGPPRRRRWDSAAERYAVAVTLFEMATGRVPAYGDPDSDPAVVEAEATIEPEMFDPAVTAPLTAFFRTALRRDAAERFDSIDDMRAAWVDAFRRVGEEPGPDPDALARAVTRETPLPEAGLSARALSALEPLDVRTVGELVAVPAMRLSRLRGANEATRREVRTRAKQWRQRWPQGPGTAEPLPADRTGTAAPHSVDAILDALVPRPTRTNDTEVRDARLLLGRPTDGEPDGACPPPWASQTERAGLLGVTPVRVRQIDAKLRRRWAGKAPALAEVRDELVSFVAAQGGVVAAPEAAVFLVASRGTTAPEPLRSSQALGLVRAAVEAELERGGDARLDRGRRQGVVLIAREPPVAGGPDPDAMQLIDYAAELGRVAAEPVGGEDVVPGPRAVQRLRRVRVPDGGPVLDDGRLLRLAASAAGTLAVSSQHELYARGLPAAAALRLSENHAVTPRGVLTPERLRERVRSRFPEAEPLPDPPELSRLVRDGGLPLVWDAGSGGYVMERAASSSGYATVRPTSLVPRKAHDEVDERLRESIEHRGYLVLGASPRKLEQARDALADRYDLDVVDVTAVLLGRMRALAEENAIPWDLVLAADAREPSSADGHGLRGLVTDAMGAVRDALDGAARTVLLTETGPVVRYGHLDMLARLADHATARPAAVWLLVPARSVEPGPTLEGQPVPVISPAQWLRLPDAWVSAAVSPAA